MNLVYVGLIKLLAVLGFGFISYEGFDILIDSFISLVQGNLGGMGGNIASIISMAGFTDAIGYFLSAVSTKAALVATKKFLPR